MVIIAVSNFAKHAGMVVYLCTYVCWWFEVAVYLTTQVLFYVLPESFMDIDINCE